MEIRSNNFLENFLKSIKEMLHEKEKIKIDHRSNEKRKEERLEKLDALECEKLTNLEKNKKN